MKRSILVLAVVASLLVVSPVKAEDASIAPSSSPTTSGIRQVRQEMKQERQELRDERKTTMQAIRGQFNLTRASARATMLTKKFEFIAKRFDSILGRFDSRITTIESSNKSIVLTTVKAKLADAKAKLVLARAAGILAVDGFKAITANSTKDDFAKLQVLVKTANDAYKAVNVALKDALKELKTVSKPALPAASAAVSNSL